MKELPFSCANNNNGTGDLIALNQWLDSVGVQPITAWRWRRKGWLPTINICGRVYVSREVIANFERRAAMGEFAKEHKAPKKENTTN